MGGTGSLVETTVEHVEEPVSAHFPFEPWHYHQDDTHKLREDSQFVEEWPVRIQVIRGDMNPGECASGLIEMAQYAIGEPISTEELTGIRERFTSTYTDASYAIIDSASSGNTETTLLTIRNSLNEPTTLIADISYDLDADEFTTTIRPVETSEDLRLTQQIIDLRREKYRLRQELEIERAARERAEQLVGKLLGQAAHDYRNPLMIIQGYAGMFTDLSAKELLEIPSGEEESILGIGTKAIQNAARLQEMLINAHLLLGTGNKAKMAEEQRPITSAELFGEINELWAAKSANKNDGKNITLENHGVETIFGHEGAFKTIIWNYLQNADKYGGQNIEVGIEEREGRIVLYVQDDGNGVPQESVERIFGRGEQNDDGKGKGFGLGLFTVSEMAKLIDGKCGVEAHPATGRLSRFYVEVSPTGIRREM